MNNDELILAKERFQERLDSLKRDTERCFWNIKESGAPGYAFFPPVMYAFATIDYFSSYWAGWNQNRPDKSQSQTKRLTAFITRYCPYHAKEVQIAVAFWRHKLMHTAEPRTLKNKNNNEIYEWSINKKLGNHMILAPTGDQNRFILEFSPLKMVDDLREGVFGSRGYFTELQTSKDLQEKYLKCLSEMENYEIELEP